MKPLKLWVSSSLQTEERGTEKSEAELLTPGLHSKRIPHTPLLSQAMPHDVRGWHFKSNSSSCGALGIGRGDRTLNPWATLGRLDRENWPFLWGFLHKLGTYTLNSQGLEAPTLNQQDQPIQKTTLLYEMAQPGRNLLINLWMAQVWKLESMEEQQQNPYASDFMNSILQAGTWETNEREFTEN